MTEAVELMAKQELKHVAPVIFAWRHTRERWIIVNNLATIYVRNADLWYPPFMGHGDSKILLGRGFPLINCADEEGKHDIIIEWYDGVRNRINIDGFAVVVALYPGRHILIHSRCCGSNKVVVYEGFKQLIEGIGALNISNRDREFLVCPVTPHPTVPNHLSSLSGFRPHLRGISAQAPTGLGARAFTAFRSERGLNNAYFI